jgi:hypothetical protein
MKRSFLPLCAVLGGLSSPVLAVELLSAENPARAGTARAVYAEGQAFFANDIVPLSQANRDWSWGYHPREGKNLALISTRIETGMQWQGFRLGYISRNEWMATANRDSLDIVRADRQNASYDNGRNYSLDYRLRGFAADGARLTKSFSNDLGSGWTLGWGAAASALRGRRVRSEDITGNATATGGRNFTASVDWTRDYSHTDTAAEGYVAAFRDGNPTGQGYSADLGISLGRQDGWRLEWTATDAVGRMSWRDIPEKTLSGSNLPGAALPGGRKVRVDLTQSLPVKHALSLSIPTSVVDFELADTFFQGVQLPRIGLSKRLNADWTARLDYDIRFATVGLGLSYRWLYLNVRSDSPNVNKARAFGFGLGARLDF